MTDKFTNFETQVCADWLNQVDRTVFTALGEANTKEEAQEYLEITPGGAGSGVSADADNLLIVGTDDLPYASADEITPAAIGAATAAQGGLADTAVQPEDLGSAAMADTGDFATAAQGSAADSSVQPGDDAADLGSGSATDGYVLTADGAGGAAWEAVSGGGGGVSDHGALTGLGDDDHTQYHTDARGDARYSLTGHAHTGTYDPAGTAASAVSAHASAADPHTGYALESALGGAAALSVGTTTGTVCAGDDSRLSNARTPTAHAASHATGQADALSASSIGAEPALGNPSTTGYVLSSTNAGVRSWVAQSGGVDTTNSPGANEFARFTDSDTIEGRTAAEVRGDLGVWAAGGVREFYVDAGAMVPRKTNGAFPYTEEYATNDVVVDYYLFDSTTEEGVQFKLVLPDAWDRGNIKAKFIWDAASGASANDVVRWTIAARAVSNDDAIDAAFPSATTVDDTVIAVGDNHTTAATSAFAVSGSPAIGDLIVFQITRYNSGVSTNMSEDAKLLGVQIQYTELTTAPSAW